MEGEDRKEDFSVDPTSSFRDSDGQREAVPVNTEAQSEVSLPLAKKRKEIGHCEICDSPLASFTCACTAPPFYFCDICLPDHLRVLGLIHIPMSTFLVKDKAATTSHPCSECATKEAVSVCVCSVVQWVKYCEACYNFHCAQGRHSLHYKLPLSAAQSVVDSGQPIDQFLKRQRFIDELREKLRENLEKVDQLVTATQHEFETALKQLMDEKSKRMKDLFTLRAEVAQLITDAETVIEQLRYRTDYTAGTFLEELVLSGWKQKYDYSRQVTELFTAQVDITAVKEAVSRCVRISRNFTGFAQSGQIPLISVAKKGKVVQLHLPTCTKNTVSVPETAIDSASSLCLIDPESLISCGGSAHNKVYLINLQSQSVTLLSPMSHTRGFAGAVRYCDYLHVFGGIADSATLHTAEKLDLKANNWLQITHRMVEPRAGVTPTLYDGLIYIVGGFGKNTVEAFHTDSQQFIPIPILLPSNNVCASFLYDGELMVVQGTNLLQWKAGDTEFRTREVEKAGEGWCCSSPVSVQWEVFFVQSNSDVLWDVIKCNVTARFVSKVRTIEL